LRSLRSHARFARTLARSQVLTLPPTEELKDEDDEMRMSMISTGLLDDEGRKADPFGRKIAPHLGVMAGPCFSCDYVVEGGQKKGLFGGGGPKNEVQEFWYGLSDDSLMWYKYKEGTYTSTRHEGKIELENIINIMPESMNGTLRKCVQRPCLILSPPPLSNSPQVQRSRLGGRGHPLGARHCVREQDHQPRPQDGGGEEPLAAGAAGGLGLRQDEEG
jgi:hypothetical protein